MTIKGDVGDYTAAYGKSGSVTVKGNAGNETGSELNGASVVVEGNARKSTASGAESGVIRVEGKIRGLAIIIGGEVKIVEARKQVWPGRWNWLKWKLGLREYLPNYTKQNEP